MADLVQKVTGTPYLFDHRGLMADEYADAEVWRRGSALYDATQRLERRFIERAAGVVVLTERYGSALSGMGKRLSVIPCAVDLGRFYPGPTEKPRPFDLVYAGAWSGLYLVEETLRFFETYRTLQPAARMLLLVAEGSDLGSLPAGVEARHPTADEVPGLLRQARAGLSLRREGRAQVAASPVKVSEYLASGLLVVSSTGVGDLDLLLPERRVGVVIRDFSEASLEAAATGLIRLLDEGRAAESRCRELAEERYALENAIDRYDRAYRGILETRGKA
jgi:glycosyltransferase involved in cell wall biosynthesis